MEKHIWYWEHAKQLSGIYDETFNKIETYFNSFTLKPIVREECLSEILDLLLHAQKENRPAESLFGEDMEAFCISYVKAVRNKDTIYSICQLFFYAMALALFFLLMPLFHDFSPFSKDFWKEPVDIIYLLFYPVLLYSCRYGYDLIARKKIFKYKHFYGNRYNLIRFIVYIISFIILLTISLLYKNRFMITGGYVLVIAGILFIISGITMLCLGHRNKGIY